ncbi:MAG: toxin-antitoxin system HicB family antitoxin [Deltaproteobacteria bacterium]|jgi:plasmid stability protein|nr:toxin-antitoxin system HicB family antitoxin [Deltaproteobacteria bacterium]
MKQLTLRGFDKDLERRLRREAAEQGVSLNRAALRLLRRGAGIATERAAPPVIGTSLDDLIGCWTRAEERAFLKALEPFESVDPELWR